MRQKMFRQFTGLFIALLLGVGGYAQTTSTTEKRIRVPELKQPVKKSSPINLQDGKSPDTKSQDNKPKDDKLQESTQQPPKIKPKEPPKKKTSYAYGIRPPANSEQEEKKSQEEKKPSARMGIRPPVPEEEEEKEVKEPKLPSKSRKPGNTTANKKPKVEAPKKTLVPEPSKLAEPAAPVIVEPAPVITSGETGDPKFGIGGGVVNGGETGFLNRVVTVSGVTYRYQVFVPRSWHRRQTWPVVLFLHGAGERGDDGVLQTEVGIGTAIRRDVARFPAIVVLPQCRRGAWWTEAPMQAQALAALEQSIREFNGDRARLYLTGISMGGFGTWGLATNNAGKFAAYAPVCGALKLNGRMMVDVKADDPYTIVARLVGQTPTWIFHGGDDKVVLTEESRKMHEALKASGGNVQYTEYPGVGHNSWDKAYADPKLMEWLLAQRLRK
jgi:predicted esterase